MRTVYNMGEKGRVFIVYLFLFEKQAVLSVL